jgi:hypothetical protein
MVMVKEERRRRGAAWKYNGSRSIQRRKRVRIMGMQSVMQ